MEDPNFIQSILGNQVVNIVTLIVTCGAAISAAFPSKLGKDTWFYKALQVVLDISNVVGLNVGKAKNQDDV